MPGIPGVVAPVRPGSVEQVAIQPELFPTDAFATAGNTTATPTLTLLSPWQLLLATLSGSNLVPVGGGLPWFAAAAPTGFLLCDGSSLLRATYAALFGVIGTTFGSADGTHFNLPNFQGISLTGVGAQNINARTKTGPALGEVREDQGQGHVHQEKGVTNTGATYYGPDTQSRLNTYNSLYTLSPSTDGTNGTPRTGTYTHGPEIGVNWIIKY